MPSCGWWSTGAVGVNRNALPVMESHQISHINLRADIQRQYDALARTDSSEPESPEPGVESRDTMQDEAVAKVCERIKENAQATGCSRGRIILPCGTGKSRIALRIIEQLTEPGHVSAILCPSIALVAQLRGEFLMHSQKGVAALAVCSDQTAARGTDLSKDQTADLSQTSARDVKGTVTTDADEISEWIEAVPQERLGVIFGTYQSSYKIAQALQQGNHQLACMIADEAHRTAGIKRVESQEQQLRDFTVCHDQTRFPAKYRVYQTATPKVYKTAQQRKADDRLAREGKWVVRSMDDENVFGPELYRRSYADAVANGWLSDYRIIALGVNDKSAYDTANRLAGQEGSKLSTVQVIRGLALALIKAGATAESTGSIKSSINFLNTIRKSEQMVEVLQSDAARKFVAERLDALGINGDVPHYRLRHLDASSNVAKREEAKAELAAATAEEPRGILNVGIFGEGTDAPSLSAVGFIEPRKSPVDVIQAVGRVMRRSPGKHMGYIICPIVIPKNARAEDWMADTDDPDDGWQALGQILLALRAHDERIEHKLADLMEMYLPSDADCEPPLPISAVVALGSDDGRTSYHLHEGQPGEAQAAAADCVEGKARPIDKFRPLNQAIPDKAAQAKQVEGLLPPPNPPKQEPEIVIAAKPAPGSDPNAPVVAEVRQSNVVRAKPKPDGTPGPLDIDRTKKKALKMVNGEEGRKVPNPKQLPRAEQMALRLLDKSSAEQMGIYVNLLERSGLCRSQAARSVNLLEEAIGEARLRLNEDGLEPHLAKHFRITDSKNGKKAADGCTVASLLLMNAAMLHQRIVAGGWLPRVRMPLDEIKASPEAKTLVYREWNQITRHDFKPVIEPAIEVIELIEDTGFEAGLNKAIRHLVGEAERLAADYAEMGADYAGELFNKVMGNQDSDGAFFTRPPAAALLAALALDAAMPPDTDWTAESTWNKCRMVDLACGSGTLLAAALAEMKRRAAHQGADSRKLAALQKLAVEDTIAGLDFNPVSLQLAAAQLTAGNTNVAYRRMGLHRMDYGTDPQTGHTAAGSLELLTQSRVLDRNGELDLGDAQIGAKRLETGPDIDDNPDLEDAVDAATNAKIVIMNPPFTSREKMGEKFPPEIRKRLRERVDGLERTLVQSDPELDGFVSKTSIGPLFEALAEKCADEADGVVAMVWPSVAFAGPSTQYKRQALAKRFHIHTILTNHQPKDINLSQNTSINESLIVARRHEARGRAKPPTRIISLDRMPTDERQVAELRDCLVGCDTGLLADGWGEVSHWPVERIEAGDWTAGVFRSRNWPKLHITLPITISSLG